MALKTVDLTQQPHRAVFTGSSEEEITYAKTFWQSIQLLPPMESRLVSSDIKQRLRKAPPSRSVSECSTLSKSDPRTETDTTLPLEEETLHPPTLTLSWGQVVSVDDSAATDLQMVTSIGSMQTKSFPSLADEAYMLHQPDLEGSMCTQTSQHPLFLLDDMSHSVHSLHDSTSDPHPASKPSLLQMLMEEQSLTSRSTQTPTTSSEPSARFRKASVSGRAGTGVFGAGGREFWTRGPQAGYRPGQPSPPTTGTLTTTRTATTTETTARTATTTETTARTETTTGMDTTTETTTGTGRTTPGTSPPSASARTMTTTTMTTTRTATLTTGRTTDQQATSTTTTGRTTSKDQPTTSTSTTSGQTTSRDQRRASSPQEESQHRKGFINWGNQKVRASKDGGEMRTRFSVGCSGSDGQPAEEDWSIATTFGSADTGVGGAGSSRAVQKEIRRFRYYKPAPTQRPNKQRTLKPGKPPHKQLMDPDIAFAALGGNFFQNERVTPMANIPVVVTSLFFAPHKVLLPTVKPTFQDRPLSPSPPSRPPQRMQIPKPPPRAMKLQLPTHDPDDEKRNRHLSMDVQIGSMDNWTDVMRETDLSMELAPTQPWHDSPYITELNEEREMVGIHRHASDPQLHHHPSGEFVYKFYDNQQLKQKAEELSKKAQYSVEDIISVVGGQSTDSRDAKD